MQASNRRKAAALRLRWLAFAKQTTGFLKKVQPFPLKGEGLSAAVQLFFIIQQLDHFNPLYLCRGRLHDLPGKCNGDIVAGLQIP